MALSKRSPCYCGAVLAALIIVLALLAHNEVITGTWVIALVVIAAAILGIGSITGLCCNCSGKGQKSEQAGSCCQPPSQGQ